MKFLHTADWQIGMKAAHVGAAAEEVRAERLEAGRRVVELARERGAEFLIVAGDVFEDDAVERVLVQKVGDILAKFPGPVYLLPGNHDPLGPGSVWEHSVWSSHENLVVLREPEPVPVPGGTLYPCPLAEKHGDRDPTRWIPAEGGEGIRIGIAHGSLEGILQEIPEFPIPRDAAERSGLDYLALGHWHSFGTVPDAAGVPRTVYSGTHETTKFGERDSGTAALVEIDSPGAVPAVERLATGGLAWRVLEDALESEGDLSRVEEALEAIPDPERTLVLVRLAGLLFPGDGETLERIREIRESRFLGGRVEADELRPAPSDPRWVEDLPAGPVRMAAERLAARDDPAAARALLRLFRIAREVGT